MEKKILKKYDSWSKDKLARSIIINIIMVLMITSVGICLEITNDLCQFVWVALIIAYVVGIYLKLEILKEK